MHLIGCIFATQGIALFDPALGQIVAPIDLPATRHLSGLRLFVAHSTVGITTVFFANGAAVHFDGPKTRYPPWAWMCCG